MQGDELFQFIRLHIIVELLYMPGHGREGSVRGREGNVRGREGSVRGKEGSVRGRESGVRGREGRKGSIS